MDRQEARAGGVPIRFASQLEVSRGSGDAVLHHSRLPRLSHFVHPPTPPQGVATFDATAFSISEAEAALMDPQQRLLLECVGEALLGEGSARVRQAPEACGVFVGASWQDYGKLASEALGVTAYTATGVAGSVVSGRLAYTFGLKGPTLSIDTGVCCECSWCWLTTPLPHVHSAWCCAACSSSLVGLHMAFNALLLRQCATAAAAGVNLILHPETSAIAQKAGMLAPDARCKTLSAAADGYGRAEAVGAALLEAAALDSDESSALALVAGSAVNQDGRSSSLTAPNGPSQQDVVRAALRVAALPAAAVAVLQMHGTGTPLGDPIEVGAAAAVLVDGVARQLPLALMAAKSWIGHAEPAAGVVGLAHAHAALAAAVQLPLLHLRAVNEHVAAIMGRSNMGAARGGAPWSAPRQGAALPSSDMPDAPRVVGASAFAFQGTNAHVLVQSSGHQQVDWLASCACWERQRHWATPAPHRCAAVVGSAEARCMCEECCAVSSHPPSLLQASRVASAGQGRQGGGGLPPRKRFPRLPVGPLRCRQASLPWCRFL